VTAAGYDLSDANRARHVLQQWDAICGLARLRVMHFNDSVGGVGSRIDRHAHIGEGCCGKACFACLMNHPALAGVPKILETPKDEPGDDPARDWDALNLKRLRRMLVQPRSQRTADNPRRCSSGRGKVALPGVT
jgi:deoxyribonuclease-4